MILTHCQNLWCNVWGKTCTMSAPNRTTYATMSAQCPHVFRPFFVLGLFRGCVGFVWGLCWVCLWFVSKYGLFGQYYDMKHGDVSKMIESEMALLSQT
jgi:hypothetical protein